MTGKPRHIDHKVPGGKLIRLDVEIEMAVIRSVRITGDFFIHPEDSIEGIERFLIGKTVSKDLGGELGNFLESKQITTVGISAADIMDAIMAAK